MNSIKRFSIDREFLKRTGAIAIPIALQGFLNNFLNLVDTIMIGKLICLCYGTA